MTIETYSDLQDLTGTILDGFVSNPMIPRIATLKIDSEAEERFFRDVHRSKGMYTPAIEETKKFKYPTLLGPNGIKLIVKSNEA